MKTVEEVVDNESAIPIPVEEESAIDGQEILLETQNTPHRKTNIPRYRSISSESVTIVTLSYQSIPHQIFKQNRNFLPPYRPYTLKVVLVPT